MEILTAWTNYAFMNEMNGGCHGSSSMENVLPISPAKTSPAEDSSNSSGITT